MQRTAATIATTVRQTEANPDGPEARLRASLVAAGVHEAAEAVVAANVELAKAVAHAVAVRAELVAANRHLADRAFDAEVLAATRALEGLALRTIADLSAA